MNVNLSDLKMVIRIWRGAGYKSIILRSGPWYQCKFRNIKMYNIHGNINLQLLIFGFKKYNNGFEIRLFNISMICVY